MRHIIGTLCLPITGFLGSVRVPKMRMFLLLFLVASLAACKPTISADIYTRDIVDVAEIGKTLTVPVRMGLPIMEEKKCEEDKNKMLPSLQKYGTEVKFLTCEDLPNEMHDLIVFEMTAQIVRHTPSEVTTVEGMFGLSVSKIPDGSLIVRFLKTENVDNAMSEIDNNYEFQDTRIDDIALTLRLNNDLRKDVKVEIEGSFVDGKPIDPPTIFIVPRRGRKDIVPSNVRSKSIVSTGEAVFLKVLPN